MPLISEYCRQVDGEELLKHGCIGCGFSRYLRLDEVKTGLALCKNINCLSMFLVGRQSGVGAIPVYPRFGGISHCPLLHNRHGLEPFYSPRMDIDSPLGPAQHLLSVRRADYENYGCPSCGFACSIEIPRVDSGMRLCANRSCWTLFFLAEDMSDATKQSRTVLTGSRLALVGDVPVVSRIWSTDSYQTHPRQGMPRWMYFSSGPGIDKKEPMRPFFCAFCREQSRPSTFPYAEEGSFWARRASLYCRDSGEAALAVEFFPNGILYKDPESDFSFHLYACEACAKRDPHRSLECSLGSYQITKPRLRDIFNDLQPKSA